MATSGTSSPCGACKFLRRKCASDCIFAPYFTSEQGAVRFAAIHKVFGASNLSKLLLHIPVADRCEAVVTIAYEAQARLRDPFYGCVSHIFALQQQVACLQTQLMQVKAQLAQGLVDSTNLENHWLANIAAFLTNYATNISHHRVRLRPLITKTMQCVCKRFKAEMMINSVFNNIVGRAIMHKMTWVSFKNLPLG